MFRNVLPFHPVPSGDAKNEKTVLEAGGERNAIDFEFTQIGERAQT